MSASFGELVRRGRDEAGLSQSRLGHLIGKSPTTIRSWEHGRSNPSDPQTVAAIAAILALDEDELLNTAGFEASPVKVHPSARQALTSLASERTELIALAPEPAMHPISTSTSSEVSTQPKSPDADPPEAPDWPPIPVVTDAAREVPIVVVPPKATPPESNPPEPTSPDEGEPELEIQADVPITVAQRPPVSGEVPKAAPTIPAVVDPFSPAYIEAGRTKVRKPRARVVVTSPVASNTAGSNGFVTGRSYVEDQEEKEFYRRRGLITAGVLVFMVIVIWWALGRTGGAIGDFIESIVGLLDI